MQQLVLAVPGSALKNSSADQGLLRSLPAAYPTRTCIVAFKTSAYDRFIGNYENYAEITGTFATYYTTAANKKWAWYNPNTCATVYNAMCEVRPKIGQFAWSGRYSNIVHVRRLQPGT